MFKCFNESVFKRIENKVPFKFVMHATWCKTSCSMHVWMTWLSSINVLKRKEKWQNINIIRNVPF